MLNVSFPKPLLVCLFFLSLILPPPALATGSILVLGDSLSAGYGIRVQSGWVALLEERLRDQQLPYSVVNASISGEVSAGGLARLPRLIEEYQPRIVILELGANDGLRGYPLNNMQRQLQQIIDLSRQNDADVLLLGMQIPPNYGPRYTKIFKESFATLAEKNDLPLVPFFLEGVAGDNQLMQKDGLHPGNEAQPMLLDNVWPYLQSML